MRLREWAVGLGLVGIAVLGGCGHAEDVASAAERDVSAASCGLGDLPSVQRCGGVAASCHVCGRPDGLEAVCLQPCTLGAHECRGAQRCIPVGGLIDGGGYARIGDCPSGYCR